MQARGLRCVARGMPAEGRECVARGMQAVGLRRGAGRRPGLRRSGFAAVSPVGRAGSGKSASLGVCRPEACDALLGEYRPKAGNASLGVCRP
jgi:hypothetical protein